MALTQEEFSARFKGSPIKRAKRRGLLRNVAVALKRQRAARPRARGVGAGRITDEWSVDVLRAAGC